MSLKQAVDTQIRRKPQPNLRIADVAKWYLDSSKQSYRGVSIAHNFLALAVVYFRLISLPLPTNNLNLLKMMS